MVDFGKISYWIGRAGVQANKVIVPANFMMLIYLTTKENPIWFVLLPFAAVGFTLFLWFDHKKVIAGELSYWFNRTPEFVEMKEDIEEIKGLMRLNHCKE